MRWSHSCCAVLSALFIALPGSSSAQQLGPPNGSLVIAGGNVHSATIFKRFLELAGGPSAPIVVIPTAGSGDEYGPSFSGLRPFQDLGAVHLTVLHTRDREIADSEEFVRPLREARGVWFSGGRQWRLADAYLNTRTEKELWKVLERGGVIGGSSAGATIQGAYLVRGDTRTNTIMMGDHQQGFGFLKGTAIDQHVLKRNRQFDLIPVIEAHPDLLGIGLDENTAIVVHGDRFQVIGESYVAIYDFHEMIGDEGKFYFLAPGDAFDLVRRQALRTADVLRPLDRPAKREWSQP